MQSFVLVFVALSHLYSVHAQGNPQPNPTIVVIQPNAAVVVPTGTIKLGDPGVPPCPAYGTAWSPNAKCTVNTCYGRHNVECINMNFVDVFQDLDMFSKQKLFTETNFRPLRLTVSNSSLTSNSSLAAIRNFFPTITFSAVLSWIQELELINTDLGISLDKVFTGMVNLTTISLTRVSVESIGKVAFYGLPALRQVNIDNLQKLRRIDAGFADPLLANGACLTVYHNADGLTCDCNTVKYVQKYRRNILANSQLAAANQPAPVAGSVKYTNYTCDITIMCQIGAQKVNMNDINTDEQCKGDTVTLVAATTKDLKSAGNTIVYHGTYGIMMVSLSAIFSASITRYMTC